MVEWDGVWVCLSLRVSRSRRPTAPLFPCMEPCLCSGGRAPDGLCVTCVRPLPTLTCRQRPVPAPPPLVGGSAGRPAADRRDAHRQVFDTLQTQGPDSGGGRGRRRMGYVRGLRRRDSGCASPCGRSRQAEVGTRCVTGRGASGAERVLRLAPR